MLYTFEIQNVYNVFVFSVSEEKDEVDSGHVAMETELLAADWLQELPEDLDMCIAQRDFEGAVDLVERGNHDRTSSFL